ncbi:MAG: hypothetical protein Q8K24_10430 [Hydrogenophaga sp.]|nr:hypothetical protein [Hydrogenophaga sp.]
MSRQQISDDFGGERLVTQARPIAQTEAQPGMQAWEGLAKVFAAGDLLVENNRKRVAEEDATRARKYANSLTVDELGKAIKKGDMLASESPVFAATVQHVWGENRRAAFERDISTKLDTGEVTFDKPEDIDRYLTEYRNTELSGQSKYAVAGFDKGFAELRTKLMGATAKLNDKAIVEQAATEAADSLGNVLNTVTASDFTGDDKARTAAIMDRYHLLRKTKVMPDAASRGALLEVITRAAASGKDTLVESLLNTELPDLGTVRSVLGEDKAATLQSKAITQRDGVERQRIDTEALPFYLTASEGTLNEDKLMAWGQSPENAKYISSATIASLIDRNRSAQAAAARERAAAAIQTQVAESEYEAQKAVEAAVAGGRLWEVQGNSNPQVLTQSGGTKAFDVKGYAAEYITRATKDLPFAQQVSVWSQNGLINPDWDNQLKAGLYNLATISVDAKGKPVGELNEAGVRAIKLFKELEAISPDAARRTAGDDAYGRFSDIGFLTAMGHTESDAAAIAAARSAGATAGSPAYKLESKVLGRVADLLDTPWMDWLENKRNASYDFVRRNNPIAIGNALAGGLQKARGHEVPEWLKSDPIASTQHNTTPNTSQVSAWVRRYATLLAHSGRVGSADEALEMAVGYLSKPEVSAKVNGTLYLRSELPTPPGEREDAAQWLGKFLDAVPKPQAREMGFAASEVRLEFDERSRVYRAFVAGLPLTNPEGGLMVFTRGDISQWMREQHKAEMEATASASGYAAFKARINAEIPALQRGNRYAIVQYDKSLNGQGFNRAILSPGAYERIRKDGNHSLPLADLMRKYPAGK